MTDLDFIHVPTKQGPNGPTKDYQAWLKDQPPLQLRPSSVPDRRDNRDPQELGDRMLAVRRIKPELKLSEVQDWSNNFADWPKGPSPFPQGKKDY